MHFMKSRLFAGGGRMGTSQNQFFAGLATSQEGTFEQGLARWPSGPGAKEHKKRKTP